MIFTFLVENNGLIYRLDSYVWTEAAAQIRDWRMRLGIRLPVSVNVSRIDLYEPKLIDQLREIIVPIIRRRGYRWARLFGSYARGEAQGFSDIDVVVDRGDNRLMNVCGAAQEIYEKTGKEADVFDIAELEPGPFRDAVLGEAVQL